jgi:hypothetical protein
MTIWVVKSIDLVCDDDGGDMCGASFYRDHDNAMKEMIKRNKMIGTSEEDMKKILSKDIPSCDAYYVLDSLETKD